MSGYDKKRQCIDKETLISELVWMKERQNQSYETILREVLQLVINLPAGDSVAVVYGRWKPVYTCSGERLWGYKCNKCKVDNPTQSNYCPNCGANMKR